MKISIPKTEYPLTRILVTEGDHSFHTTFTSGSAGGEMDIDLPEDMHEDDCKVECLFLSNGNKVIDTILVKEPVPKKPEPKKPEPKKPEVKDDEKSEIKVESESKVEVKSPFLKKDEKDDDV